MTTKDKVQAIAAITALDKAFGIGGEEQRSAASAAFDKMMFGDNADV